MHVPASGAEPAGEGEEASPRTAALVGLVHASEVSWDPQVDVMQAVKVGPASRAPALRGLGGGEGGLRGRVMHAARSVVCATARFRPSPALRPRPLQAGQQVRAKIMHVDAVKARVFLSMRRTAPNPLLETLDSLVTAAAAAPQAPAGSAADTNAGGADGQLDQRPALGDLPEAAAFAGLLRAARGVHSVQLGVRLQSRASSQARAGPCRVAWRVGRGGDQAVPARFGRCVAPAGFLGFGACT